MLASLRLFSDEMKDLAELLVRSGANDAAVQMFNKAGEMLDEINAAKNSLINSRKIIKERINEAMKVSIKKRR